MVVKRATEAKVMSTFAMYRRHDSDKISLLYSAFNSVLAVRGRAPLQVIFIVNVSPSEKFLIPAGSQHPY